jgi:hypothetical protein
MSREVSIQLHQLFSIHFSHTIHIILHNINDINLVSLESILESQPDSFYIIDKKLKVNILDSTITLTGHKLNKTTWIVPEDSVGDHYIITNTLSKKDIFDTLEYLYHIFSGL